uniref:Uncharacterized protein n=1 Tax=Daphnia magna TaxID=35525 RepID=A0A0P6I395_9CRUS
MLDKAELVRFIAPEAEDSKLLLDFDPRLLAIVQFNSQSNSNSLWCECDYTAFSITAMLDSLT